jgi:hypothetical protein
MPIYIERKKILKKHQNLEISGLLCRAIIPNLTRDNKLLSLITYCQDHSHHQDLFLRLKLGLPDWVSPAYGRTQLATPILTSKRGLK